MCASSASLTTAMLGCLVEWKTLTDHPQHIDLDGRSLSVPKLAAIASGRFESIGIRAGAEAELERNVDFLRAQLRAGSVIYGINTGYGGSADARSSELKAVQRAAVLHLNAGFGETLDSEVVRAVMAVRANSLSLGYSGVRPAVVALLCDMVTRDVIPVVPLRGSVSASGDLMPLSYVATCMMGRTDARVIVKGEAMTAPKALAAAGLKPIEFEAKEALAVVNAASVAASLAARVLFDSALALLLTQVVTAQCVEALGGRMESFCALVHDCLPHEGSRAVAHNVRALLRGSALTQEQQEWKTADRPGTLKQDRYALRTAAQWLGPTVETWSAAVRRVTVELNSANDNPLIDHRSGEIVHGGNFQGISSTVAMDETRQSIQLCGRLVFAQLSEVLNHTSGHGLPPNLSGQDHCVDFGFKGVDTATAAYMSELDFLTRPLTSHVHSAEMHNQSVNSLALISARMSASALDLLQMMLSNALCVLAQAADLRWLQRRVTQIYQELMIKQKCDPSKASIPPSCQWYELAFATRRSLNAIGQHADNGMQSEAFIEEIVSEMDALTSSLGNGDHVTEVADTLGQGTRRVYLYIRQSLDVHFHSGARTLDGALSAIYVAIKQRHIAGVIIDVFSALETDTTHQ